MVLSSLTEGIGLLLLVPITQIVADQAPMGVGGSWGVTLARLPLAILLGGFVALIALRAGLVYALLARRTALSLGLVRRLRVLTQSAIIAADWRWLSAQRSADHAALIVSQSEQVGREADRAVDMASSLVTLVGLIAAALWLAWPLTLATLALGALTAMLWFALRRREDFLGQPFTAA
jgi:ATP-binding cassette subfamily C protein